MSTEEETEQTQEEKPEPEMDLVSPSDVPKKGVGRKGVDWLKVLNRIPKNRVWKLTEENEFGYKLSSVKSGVATVNADAKKTLFVAKQRTIDEKKVLFVSRA